MNMINSSLNNKRKNKVQMLAVGKIQASPFQTRQIFDQMELDSLARSIAENGLLTPISVRQTGINRYHLIAGERRLRAFKLLQIEKIPALVEEMDQHTSAIMTFIENIHRKNLNCFEEAEGIRNIMQNTGYNQNKVCSMLDMSQSTAANKLRLLKLEVSIRTFAVEAGFSERICRALLGLPTEEIRLAACKYIAGHRLNTAKAEEYIEKLKEKKPTKPKYKPIVNDMRFYFNSVDRVVKEIKNTGATVLAEKTEEDGYMCYTIKIEKARPTYQKP